MITHCQRALWEMQFKVMLWFCLIDHKIIWRFSSCEPHKMAALCLTKHIRCVAPLFQLLRWFFCKYSTCTELEQMLFHQKCNKVILIYYFLHSYTHLCMHTLSHTAVAALCISLPSDWMHSWYDMVYKSSTKETSESFFFELSCYCKLISLGAQLAGLVGHDADSASCDFTGTASGASSCSERKRVSGPLSSAGRWHY